MGFTTFAVIRTIDPISDEQALKLESYISDHYEEFTYDNEPMFGTVFKGSCTQYWLSRCNDIVRKIYDQCGGEYEVYIITYDGTEISKISYINGEKVNTTDVQLATKNGDIELLVNIDSFWVTNNITILFNKDYPYDGA